MTLHAFTITDNSIAFKFFFGDENTVQKFEGELSQPVIFSCYVCFIYTSFPIFCNHFSFLIMFFFFVVGNFSFFSRNNW